MLGTTTQLVNKYMSILDVLSTHIFVKGYYHTPRSYDYLCYAKEKYIGKTGKYEIVRGFAVKAHEGQMRRGGEEPYVCHPIRVAEMVKERGGSEEAILVALLHDVVEDTSVTFEECYQFLESEEAQEALRLVTKMEGESSAQALERLLKAGNRIALLVKACDALDNSVITEGMKDYLCSNDRSPEEASNRYLEKSRVCLEALLALESNQI